MNNNRYQHCGYVFTAVISLIIFMFVSCGDTAKKNSIAPWDDSKVDYIPATLSDVYTSASGNMIFYPAAEGDVELTYTLSLNASKKVYFIFSNSNTGSATTLPYSPSIRSADDGSEPAFSPKPEIDINTKGKTIAVRGKPEITEYNHNVIDMIEEGGRSVLDPAFITKPAKSYTAGSSVLNFKTNDGTVAATCRLARTKGDKTLYIWVADNSWGTGEGETTNTLVTDMADAFLLGGQNKIYEWITNIYGDEWGIHNRTNLIAADQPIHILLYDIDGDGAPVSGNAYTVGYFWAKDNYKKTSVSNSNEKIMFYMDAALYASGYDYWEEEIISTLAHEFQHMINFYQKTVLKGARSETWLDEMCSLMAEDFVADKLELLGPRGVPYAGINYDYTDGDTGLTNGRLPLFNYYNDTPVTAWLTGDDVLASYSTAYAFGAYLARNFGGAPLFKNIVQSAYGDHSAVTNAISDSKYKTFQALLRDWGVSVVLSDKTAVLPDTARYGYNRGGKFDSTSVILYSLGSINLYNYKFTESDPDLTGPWFSNGIADDVYKMNQGSNFYSYMGTLSGSNEWTIRLRSVVSLTVVVRD
jgi:hypothetical protein